MSGHERKPTELADKLEALIRGIGDEGREPNARVSAHAMMIDGVPTFVELTVADLRRLLRAVRGQG